MANKKQQRRNARRHIEKIPLLNERKYAGSYYCYLTNNYYGDYGYFLNEYGKYGEPKPITFGVKTARALVIRTEVSGHLNAASSSSSSSSSSRSSSSSSSSSRSSSSSSRSSSSSSSSSKSSSSSSRSSSSSSKSSSSSSSKSSSSSSSKSSSSSSSSKLP